MAKYMICLPNSAPHFVAVDCESLCNNVGCCTSALVHSCSPGDSCRNSIPCLSGDALSCLVERQIGISRRLFKLRVSGGRSVSASTYTWVCDSLKHSSDLDNATASIRVEDDDRASACTRCSQADERKTDHILKDGVVISVLFRLLGGKGGFGALLKGKGKRKKQSSNIDSCRTLSGERIRHVRLKELAERQLEGSLDSKATKLPRPKEESEGSSTKPQRETHYKYLKSVRRESKRVKKTVARGVRNLEEVQSTQTLSTTDKDSKLEQVLTKCMDLFELE